jgi:hypothetical protein
MQPLLAGNDPILKYLKSYNTLQNDLRSIISSIDISTISFVFGTITCPKRIYTLHKITVTDLRQHLLELLQLLSNQDLELGNSRFSILFWGPRGIESNLIKPIQRFKLKNNIDLVRGVWNDDPDWVWYALKSTLDSIQI